ncbi:MAG TPA: protease inhibitor I42 family protein [Spirochaetota bacterium]|nr:protease inhibitor I42 family protein [Spirochaetota bacterium]HOR43471.1 protease inhibitor I42 family protein [Spirochaetota bacterium]HOU83273.1 protease inhibitor I42 family protein [Spirochaetota bacterium]HPK55436.1 protease inhibitor I42 family protein [Spirochaetota bacterium]HQE57616.1 protease inhibitor I42 family protein [Spirochaetota bacterium]
MKYLLLIFFGIMVSCASDTRIIKIGDKEDTVTLNNGETISLSVKSQLSTGYKWSVEKKPDVIEIVSENEVITDDTRLAGGFDYQIFKIKAVKSGQGEIVLQYYQPWKKEENPYKDKKIKIIVK